MADNSGLDRPLPSNRLEEAISQPGCRREILPTSRRAPGLAWTLLVVALLASLLIALLAGKYPLRLADLLDSLASHLGGTSEPPAQQIETVLWQLRLPRILTALLVGGALAAAGAAYQGMFRNPLVSPDILGVSAGAGLGWARCWAFSSACRCPGYNCWRSSEACWRSAWSTCWPAGSGATTRCWSWCWPAWRWAPCWAPAFRC